VHQHINSALGILRCYCKVININCYILSCHHATSKCQAQPWMVPVESRGPYLYRALEIMRMCPSISPNSGPPIITRFIAV
jgi:hypothetical protein